MNEQIYAGTAQYNLIYIFSIPDDAHRGYLKIGEHSFSSPSSYKQLTDNCDELNQNAHARIRQYTKTALVQYELLHTELARIQIRLAGDEQGDNKEKDGKKLSHIRELSKVGGTHHRPTFR